MHTSLKISRIAAAVLLFAAMQSCTKTQAPAPTSSAPAGGAPVGDVIKIGEVGSMTGQNANFGVSTHNGLELAVEEANAAGGVKGKKLQVIALDDQSKADEAAAATTRLITQDRVSAIIGEVASSISLVMAPIAQTNQIPMISPSSTNPDVTKVGDYIFRVCFIDPFQGHVMAVFATDNLKAKKVAVLTDVKNDYSIGLAKFFSETFKKRGGDIVAEQSYSQGDQDFKSQLTAIRTKAPDAIFVPGYYNDVALIARQARQLGIKGPLLGGDGWDAPELKSLGGDAINNSYFSNHYSAEDKSPHIQNFISKFKAKYQKVPDGLAAMGYDAGLVLIDAMKRAPSLESKAIRDAIAGTKDFQGVTGRITIDENRNASKPAVVLKVADGEFKYQTTIAP